MTVGGEHETAPHRRRGIASRVGASARRAGSVFLGSVAGDVRGDVSRLRERAATLREMVRAERTVRREEFLEAQHRQGLSESDLAQRQSTLERLSYAYGAVALIAFVMLICAPGAERPFSQFAVSLAVMVFGLARGAASRFRSSQIESRELFDFADWALGRKGRY